MLSRENLLSRTSLIGYLLVVAAVCNALANAVSHGHVSMDDLKLVMAAIGVGGLGVAAKDAGQ